MIARLPIPRVRPPQWAALVARAALITTTLTPAARAMTVRSVRCDPADAAPLAVDVPRPRFGWTLSSDLRGDRQTAYQILVASSPHALAKDDGDLWDSGRVASADAVQVVYAGRALGAFAPFCWKVRAWDGT